MAPLTSALPSWLTEFIATNPVFRVLSVDGVCWIDPYTGAMIHAPFGFEEVARRHLGATQPWKKGPPRRLEEVLKIRWLQYLRSNVEFLPNLRIFVQGFWLNPYTGRWVGGIPLENGRIGLPTIDFLAGVLAECPEAQAMRTLHESELSRCSDLGPRHVDTGIISRLTEGQALERRPPSGRRPTPLVGAVAEAKRRVRDELATALVRPPTIEGWQVVFHYEPRSVSGRDLYDVIELDKKRLFFLVGSLGGVAQDFSAVAIQLLKDIRAIAIECHTGMDLFARLNDAFKPRIRAGTTIAMYGYELDHGQKTMTCFSADHPPAMLVSPRRVSPLAQLTSDGRSFGHLSAMDYRRTVKPLVVHLEPSDMILLPTAGLARVRNAVGETVGNQRLFSMWAKHRERGLGELVAGTVKSVKQFAGGKPTEDMTMLAIRLKDADNQLSTQAIDKTWLGGME